ncbi:MAG: hypothetical protein PVF83_06540 [Anaerolineales bacterium]|jgi:hypothetical protein
MSNEFNLKRAERKAMSLQFKDGLLEINLGIYFALLSLVGPLEESGISRFIGYLVVLGVFAAGLVVYFILKGRVVGPRLGNVKLSPRSNAPKRNLLIVAIAFVLITLVVYLIAAAGSLSDILNGAPSWIVDAGFGLAVFAFFALIGYSAQAPRYYLYGLLLGAAMPIKQIFWPDDPGLVPSPNMIAGIIMAAGGLLVFARFIRRYPVMSDEAADG